MRIIHLEQSFFYRDKAKLCDLDIILSMTTLYQENFCCSTFVVCHQYQSHIIFFVLYAVVLMDVIDGKFLRFDICDLLHQFCYFICWRLNEISKYNFMG